MNQFIEQAMKQLNLDEGEFALILSKAVAGGELEDENEPEEWITQRLLPNTVFIGKDDYARMCINALKILSNVAATDYGSSRQRDMGQLWADMMRGYLGEIAFLKFLEKWNVKARLDHEKRTLEDYLPMDIHEVQFDGVPPRPPKLRISVKTTKWNGIWLDIPGGQFNHSDIHVLVKVGVGRDHLFAFFKEISVFRDKILKIGEEAGSLTKAESARLYDALPSFKEIPAYITGFAKRDLPYSDLPYVGKKGRKNYTITGWNGPIRPGDLEEIKRREKIDGKIQFTGIGEFSHDQGYLFNTGTLLWQKEEWDRVVSSM
ncbi:MAG: hypothetical protein HZA04_01300 [Nitrospinae bacterium]|nr:hypothetical protein [Nitrospinota bacterium]